MLNQVVLVGRLVEEIKEERNDVVIAVYRAFKNEEGIYEQDIVPIQIWGGIRDKCKEYLHKGDLLGIRGRIETKEDKIVIIAEKVTFLSSKKSEE